MPLVRIDICEGKSKKFKKSLLEEVHKALMTAFKIPDYDRYQRLYEFKKDNFEHSTNKEFILIEITAFSGRSKTAKKLLYKTIVENLQKNPGINPTDIIIHINEIPLENWGLAGGKSGDEVQLGFKIKL